MPDLHYPTVSLIVAIVNGVAILVMAALWYINRDVPGPGVWTLAAISSGLGFVAVILRPQLGSAFSPVNNTLLVGAALLHVEGLLRFKQLGRPQWRWLWSVAVLVVAAVIATMHRDNAQARYMLQDPLIMTVLLTTAGLLLWRNEGRWRVIYGVCAAFVAMAALAFVLRWSIVMRAPPGSDMLQHPVMGIVFLLLLTHNLAWICGMSLAVNLRVQERLQKMALNDPLTGLANRRQLDAFASQALRRAERRGEHMAVVVLDLDGFKALNDRHGHAAGDGVLREVAKRAQNATRSTDLVARLGGDEFVVMLEGESREALDQAVNRLKRELRRTPLFDGPPTPVGFSMGVATFPEDGAHLVALLREADARMYGQKREHASTRSMDIVPGD
ncbi:GGDEF domain-containing protein [Hydrogenophaga sp. OTU3427]|uniref:GGDEF domain-containing protein n=1 Tax=Hydrogenophaga sp. OTU3427 TaxID=3043856 RepID=UPI00313AFB61